MKFGNVSSDVAVLHCVPHGTELGPVLYSCIFMISRI